MANPSQDWLTKDFYKALGVSKEASADDIKKAYRKLARQYHPDRNPGDSAAEARFKEIGEAYQVLSNADDRKQYDALRDMGAGGFRGGFPGGTGNTNAEYERMFREFFPNGAGHTGSFQGGTGGIDLGDILGGMFGAGEGVRSGFFGKRAQRGTDMQSSVSIPLRDAVNGTTVKITTVMGKSITAKIPAGVTDGQKIRIKGKGSPGSHGGESGDIIVTVNVEKHPVYELRGKDIYADVPISFNEAVLGGNVEVPTLHGETVTVKVPAGSSSGKLLRVKDKGLKGGHFYVRLKIVVPQVLSEEAERIVKLFASATNDADPRADFRDLARS